MAIELFNGGKRLCLMFDDLVDDAGNVAVQANQFLIVDNGHGALLDPGRNMTCNGLLMAITTTFRPSGSNTSWPRTPTRTSSFMHSEGNFQFYDPVGKILFSGDMGDARWTCSGSCRSMAGRSGGRNWSGVSSTGSSSSPAGST